MNWNRIIRRGIVLGMFGLGLGLTFDAPESETGDPVCFYLNGVLYCIDVD